MWNFPSYTWPQQKQKCLSCAHYSAVPDNPRLSSHSTIMLCAVNPFRGARGIGTCIDNRTRGPCGPDAKMWKGLDMKE